MTPIIGASLSTVDQAAVWAETHDAPDWFVGLAHLYWELCPELDVRPDVAYAQAAHETGFGHFGRAVTREHHNFAGIKTATPGADDAAASHATFPDDRTGVTAHRDHLHLYARGTVSPTPDPRHFAFLAGVAPTVEELSGRWAPSSTYHESIIRKIEEMAAMPGLHIVTRAEWGAKPPRSRSYIDTPTPRLWIHHTAGALDQNGNGVWWDDVRSIQDFHMRPVSEGGRGWSDIAYSFLVGGGQVFEGRGAGVAGGHTKGDNTESHAICLIGNYDTMQPTPEDLRAIADLARHGREQGWWGDITGGHRNAPGASTACPGRHLQAAIPELRALAGTPQPEDDMTPEERKMLVEIYESIVQRKTGTAGGLIHDYSKATREDVKAIRKHFETDD